jgi:uncharacterized protein
MDIIERELEAVISKKISPGKVIILNGARRVGKTVLLKSILKSLGSKTLLLNGEDINTHILLAKHSAENFRQVIGTSSVLAIDEAQRIPEIGLILKLFTDEFPELKIIVTGSSAFDLTNTIGEPLTGRKYSYTLFPLSEREIQKAEPLTSMPDSLSQRLIYGSYPELLHIPDQQDKKDYLNELVSSYLLKDILVFENIKHSAKIFNLLRLISHQTGNLVSYNELGKQLGISKNTVEKYLDLLTKVYIIFKVEGFSGNLRKEVSKSSKWYFSDNGIRNAIIAGFNSHELRNDTGQLWENYMISERIKYQHYKRESTNNFFWRTYDKQEIDWIEEKNGNLSGFEFKFSDSKQKPPLAWTKSYPYATYTVINTNNYHDWLK